MMRLIALSFVAATCACALPARAQTPTPAPSASPSATPDPCGGPTGLLAVLDRPTIGYSVCAVAPGGVLFEIGYQNEVGGWARHAFVQTQYPQNFLRVGVAPRFEFDVNGPNEQLQRTFGTGSPNIASSGASDMGLGFKYEFVPRGPTTFAIDGLYTPPNGAATLTAGNATYTANLDIAYALGANTGIATTLAFTSTGGFASNGMHARYGVFSPSVVVTQLLPHAYQPYFEYVYSSRLSPNVGGRAFIDYGLQKLLGANTEIDLELGHALTANPTLKFNYVGVGFGIQFR